MYSNVYDENEKGGRNRKGRERRTQVVGETAVLFVCLLLLYYLS